jgi:hypothetical protein
MWAEHLVGGCEVQIWVELNHGVELREGSAGGPCGPGGHTVLGVWAVTKSCITKHCDV